MSVDIDDNSFDPVLKLTATDEEDDDYDHMSASTNHSIGSGEYSVRRKVILK
jgi:hypothetical protein